VSEEVRSPLPLRGALTASLRLFDERPARPREVGLAALALAVLLAVMLVPAIAHGELLHDDWSYSSAAHFASSWPDVFDIVRTSTGHRVIGALYVTTVNWVLGDHTSLLYAWITLLSLVSATLLYTILRRLGAAWLPALVVVGLVLLFPPADSIRLWITAAGANFALSLFLGGVLLALIAFKATGRRALVLHAISLCLYAASILDYEVASGAVAAVGLLYLTQAPWRAVRWRWAADLVVAAAAALFVVSRSVQDSTTSPLQHLRRIVEEGVTITMALGNPTAAVRMPIWLVALVLAAGVVVWRLTGDRAVRRALAWVLGGVVFLAAAYIVYVPANDYYSPMATGIANRSNALGGMGFVTLLFGLTALLGTLVFRAVPRERMWTAGFCVLALAAIGWGYWRTFRTDRQAFEQSWTIQRDVLARLNAGVIPPPPRNGTLFLLGIPGETAPNVPIFEASWDLTGAIQELWGDDTLAGIPQATLSDLSCETSGVVPHGVLYADHPVIPYDEAVFVDGTTGRRVAVDDVAGCQRVRTRIS
jgi:hypothetical protein